jgi:hypothetical protein
VRGGDTLLLENLDRGHRRLETRLPSVRPKAFLVPADGDGGVEIDVRCDTVWIDTDRRLLALSWRGLCSVGAGDEEALGALVIAAESPGRAVAYEQIAKLLRDGTGTTSSDDSFTGPRPALAPTGKTGEIDPDLLPTPGPFRSRRPLPELQEPADGHEPTTGAYRRSAEALGVTPLGTPRIPLEPPVVLDAGDTVGVVSSEELTRGDLADTASMEEPTTLTRDAGSADSAPKPLAIVFDEPSTRPLPARPRARADLGAIDYARIAVAAERGQAAAVLVDYGLSLDDLPLLRRTWSEERATSPAFAAAFAEAVAAARRG